MKKLTYIMLALGAITFYWCLDKMPATARTPRQTSPESQTKTIVAAANVFLNTLTADQRKIAQYEFLRPKVASPVQFNMTNMRRGPGGPPNGQKPGNGDTTQGGPVGPPNVDSTHHGPDMAHGGGKGKSGGMPSSGEQYGHAVWSNFPISITPRPGIELGSLNAAQRAAATNLLQAALSAEGYKKVQEIMGSDQALADGGTDFVTGKDHYLIGIYGVPDNTKPWMIEFGGHHLGLNVVIAGPRGALTPTLTGAQPAVYTANGQTVRVLAQENDKAFALLNALDTGEQKKAILNYTVGDLVLGPGHDGQVIVPEGLKGSEMTVQQQQLMLSLMEEWSGIINDAYQAARLTDLRAGLNDTYFAWSGPVTHAQGRNGTAYYRIQGPKVIIEFAPQSTFGDPDNHVHTIYRDPTNEYGTAYSTQ